MVQDMHVDIYQGRRKQGRVANYVLKGVAKIVGVGERG